MQKAKAEAEEAARAKTESTDQSSGSKESDKIPAQEADKTSTPKQEESNETASTGERTKTSSSTAPSSSRSKHQKTRSESAREATFASLQRALNAAVAARDHYGDDGNNQPITDNMEESVSPTTTPAATNNSSNKRNSHNEGNYNAPLEWEGPKDNSIGWGSQESYGYAHVTSLNLYC